MEQDERELPTIQEIEAQIWKIAKSDLVGSMQLKACRFLIKRIEARPENAGKPRNVTVEFVETGEPEAAEKDTGA